MQKCDCGGVVNSQLNLETGKTDKMCGSCNKILASITNEELQADNWRNFWKEMNKDDDSRINLKINSTYYSLDS